jgi:DNA helicase-2/ATP-dependent DNA helicase PcrA
MPSAKTIDQRITVVLTDQQLRIVAHDRGPALVYAVAGAGKTTAMVHRVERLVRERVFAPQRILLSSFNKSAVEDLGRALTAWPHCRQVARHTLHALGYRIVRDAADRGRLPRLLPDHLKVNGEERQLVWMAKDRARQRGLVAPGELDALDEDDLRNFIGACKGNLLYPDLAAANLPPEALKVAQQAEAPLNLPWYLDLYQLHEEVRRERGWLTFDDMLLLGWEALVRHPDVLALWQRSFDCVIVDEFQDVNLAQSEMLDLLTRPHDNYMAIGDDDQTIYGFRGASMGFFRDFGRRYEAAIYEMTDNFRCQASQVVLANRVIAQNKDRHPKTLVATQGFDGATALRRSRDVAAMSRQIVEDITSAQAAGRVGSEVAILVRVTAQTPPIEQALIEAGIPYRVAEGEPFFRRREIVDLLRYVELADYDQALRSGQRLGGEDGERFAACWRSLYNRPKRYLTRQLFQETTDAVLRQGRPLSEVFEDLTDKVGGRTADTLQDLADLLVWLAEARDQLPADELLRELDWRLGYQDFLIRNSGFAELGAGYAANVAAFIQYAQGKGIFEQLQTHLAELETARKELDAGDPRAVGIRTIHKAKGLEWPVVLIPNCNAGTIPVGNAFEARGPIKLLASIAPLQRTR